MKRKYLVSLKGILIRASLQVHLMKSQTVDKQ